VKLSSTDPGLVVSGVGHLALLLAILVAFSDAKHFEDAQESIPVEMVTDQQFAQIMKGEKTEKEIRQQPTRVDKVADISETHKAPPVAEAQTDVPTPPPRLRHIPDPGEDDQPQQQPQQQQAAVPPPPPRPPDPPKPATKPAPTPPPRPDAEAIAPQPPPRPKDEPKKAEVTPPRPPVRPTPVKPKPDDKFKLDEVARIIDATKTDKPSAKPRSGDQTVDDRRLDLADVSRLLSRDAPQQRASTGRELSHLASLGSPTASAPKMSPSLWGQLDGLMQEQYKRCWSYLGLNNADQYIPEIAVQFTPDGSLAAEPKLRNPPSDPNMRSLAESALRAVQRCNPLQIPAQYTPYYDQWKSRILRFDPEEMAG
jgi:colicin import membrane protein